MNIATSSTSPTTRSHAGGRTGPAANERCDQENLIEQLKNGVKAMKLPVDNLVSNWAYMVMASLAWTPQGVVRTDAAEEPRPGHPPRRTPAATETRRRADGVQAVRGNRRAAALPDHRSGRRLLLSTFCPTTPGSSRCWRA